MTRLARLLKDAMAAHDPPLSSYDVALRIKAMGFPASSRHIRHILAGEVETPSVRFLKALQQVLNIPDEHMWRALIGHEPQPQEVALEDQLFFQAYVTRPPAQKKRIQKLVAVLDQTDAEVGIEL